MKTISTFRPRAEIHHFLLNAFDFNFLSLTGGDFCSSLANYSHFHFSFIRVHLQASTHPLSASANPNPQHLACPTVYIHHHLHYLQNPIYSQQSSLISYFSYHFTTIKSIPTSPTSFDSLASPYHTFHWVQTFVITWRYRLSLVGLPL